MFTLTPHNIIVIAHRVIGDDEIVNRPFSCAIKHKHVSISGSIVVGHRNANIGEPVLERTDARFEGDGDVFVQRDRLQNARIEFKVIAVIPNHLLVLTVNDRDRHRAHQHSIDQIRGIEQRAAFKMDTVEIGGDAESGIYTDS